MEIKFNDATKQRPDGERIIDAPLVAFDLMSSIQQIRNEPAWKNGERNALTVFKTNGLRILLVGLHEHAEMSKHKAEGLISVQVLEGRMEFNTDESSVELKAGQMLALHAGIPHSVIAKEETIFLLTLRTS